MAQLDVIFGKAGETAIDPVCKMTVKKASPGGGTAEHEGETYYFCGPGCREAFVADPAKFLGADAADMGHMEHGDHEGHEHHEEHAEHADHEHGHHAEHAGPGTAVCYPCNHNVEMATAAHWEYKGTTFYFCSTGCEEKVKAEPEKWLVIANSRVSLDPHAGHDHH
jgi:P-type Cu+ transporter